LDTKVQSGQVTLRTDIDEVQEQVRRLNGRVEENERLVKRAVERDLGDQDAERASVSNLSERVATLEGLVEQHNRYLNLPPVQPKPAAGAATPTPAAVKPEPTPSAAVEPKTKESELYDKSIALYRDGKYEEAIEGFRTFLKTFPKSDRADNAHFWIGESYMSLKQYEQAILAYQDVIKNYPKGNKVPSALLRQALAFLEIKDQTSAKLLLSRVVKNYPSSSEAKIAQKKLETLK
jgi:tol-pal system protein YbgF